MDDHIGKVLKVCRERAGLTQWALANKIHVDRTTVTKVETGDLKNPSYTLVKEWANATNGHDLIGLHFSGMDGWKKLKTYQEKIEKIRELVSFLRIRKEKRHAAKARN